MKPDDWNISDRRFLGVIFDGTALEEFDDSGNLVTGNSILILVNSFWEPVEVTLPPKAQELYESSVTFNDSEDLCWKLMFETSGDLSPSCWELRSKFPLSERSMAAFELADKDENLPAGL